MRWRSSMSSSVRSKSHMRRPARKAPARASDSHAFLEALHQIVAAALQEQPRIARRLSVALISSEDH